MITLFGLGRGRKGFALEGRFMGSSKIQPLKRDALTTAWSITMASTIHHLPITTPLFYMGLFGVGALIMRGAGCTINDMWDAKYDAAVGKFPLFSANCRTDKEQTTSQGRHNPISSVDISRCPTFGGIGSIDSAQLVLVCPHLSQLTPRIVLGASSLGLVVIYPLMKRITYYPQIIFGMSPFGTANPGLTFNWGVFLGWSAVVGAVDWTITAPMYIGGVLWGVMYDTIYAHQVSPLLAQLTSG
jgi:4-hydroxybenzoate polyprenyltransferase